MEYKGMPSSWTEYYEIGLQKVNSTFNCQCTDGELKCVAGIMRDCNPRVKYREYEISPITIFKDAIGHWKNISNLQEVINVFWQRIDLTVKIYDDSVAVLQQLKKQGYMLATMTDIPCAMPDEMMKMDIKQLLPYFDLYVSSQSCGYRKPNPKGLNDISLHFSVLADEMLFIGDEIKDRKAAENFGCSFVQIDRSGSSANTVQDMKELIEIINRSV